MAFANISVISPGGSMLPPALKYRTEAAGTQILVGEPCKVGGTGNNYVVPSADAEPLTSAPTFVGIAQTSSTETATLDGEVDVLLNMPGVVYACVAKDTALISTDAELLAVLNDNVLFDLTGDLYSVDTAAAAATNGLKIVGGDIVSGIVYFVIRTGATILA